MTGRPRGPEVAVVIPTRDRGDWLPRTLLCALHQEAVEAEIIVVDDGSRIPVERVLSDEAIAAIRIVRHDRSRGVAEARNSGVAAATAPWVAFLDDDDLWAPTKLRRQLDAAAASAADLAFSGGVAIDRRGRVIDAAPAPAAGPDLHRRLLSARVVPYIASNVVARTSLVRQIGASDPQFSHLADWDLIVRLSAAGSAACVAEPLIAYRLHGANLQQDETGLSEELARFTAKHAAAREAAGVSVDLVGWWEWRVSSRRLGRDRRGTAAAYWQLARRARRPQDLVRAAVVWGGGERAMGLARGLRQGRAGGEPPRPAWLDGAIDPPPAALRALCR